MIREKDKRDHDNGLLGMVTSAQGDYGWKHVVTGGCEWLWGGNGRFDRKKGEIGKEGGRVSSRSCDLLNTMIC